MYVSYLETAILYNFWLVLIYGMTQYLGFRLITFQK